MIATGTIGDNLQYYESQFKRYGVHQHITAYQPRSHASMQSKKDKVEAYFLEEKISHDDVYFFDDAKANVDAVKEAGFNHSFQVTEGDPLTAQLESLVSNLSSSAQQIVALSAQRTYASIWQEDSKHQSSRSTRGYNQEDQDKPCCAMM